MCDVTDTHIFGQTDIKEKLEALKNERDMSNLNMNVTNNPLQKQSAQNLAIKVSEGAADAVNQDLSHISSNPP